MWRRFIRVRSCIVIASVFMVLAAGCSPVAMQTATQSEVPSGVQPSEGFTVVKVKDGDSVVVTPAGKDEPFECHLYGVDAPELAKNGKPGQFFAEEAKAALARLVESGPVNVMVTSRRF